MKHTANIPFVPSDSYPTRTGNRLRPLIDGEPAFRRIGEVIEEARQSVWATVTFLWATFEMPDGLGSARDVLDRAASRGIDVRLIFWRPDAETASLRGNAFWGSADHIRLLEGRRSGVKIRWDRAHPGFCQHQKSWLMDVGTGNETAFVGGINLNPQSMVAPGHIGENHNHDVYLELTGPSTVDVHHNFVQRWNEASELTTKNGRWGTGSETNLPFPDRLPAKRGDAVVQIQRTIHPGRYSDGQASPGAASFPIASGERSIFDQYCIAIDTARRSIYLENQYVTVREIVDRLYAAVERGVVVVVLVPAEKDLNSRVQTARCSAVKLPPELAHHHAFTLAGIAGVDAEGIRTPVHVHSKIMLVDDDWATIGSCNLHRFSLFGNSEMNAAFSEPNTVRAFRDQLLREHLDRDTSRMDDRESLQLFRKIAQENRRKLEAGDRDWQGLAFELDLANICRSGW